MALPASPKREQRLEDLFSICADSAAKCHIPVKYEVRIVRNPAVDKAILFSHVQSSHP